MRDRFGNFINVGDFVVDSASGNGLLCFGVVRETNELYIRYSPIKPSIQNKEPEVCQWTLTAMVPLTLTVITYDVIDKFNDVVGKALGEL